MVWRDPEEVLVVPAGLITFLPVGRDGAEEVVCDRRPGTLRFDLQERGEMAPRLAGGARVRRLGLRTPQGDGPGHPVRVGGEGACRRRFQITGEVGARRFVVPRVVAELSDEEERLADPGGFPDHDRKGRLRPLAVASLHQADPEKEVNFGVGRIGFRGPAEKRERGLEVSPAKPRQPGAPRRDTELFVRARNVFGQFLDGRQEGLERGSGPGPFLPRLVGETQEVMDAVGVRELPDRFLADGDGGVPVGRLRGCLAFRNGVRRLWRRQREKGAGAEQTGGAPSEERREDAEQARSQPCPGRDSLEDEEVLALPVAAGLAPELSFPFDSPESDVPGVPFAADPFLPFAAWSPVFLA